MNIMKKRMDEIFKSQSGGPGKKLLNATVPGEVVEVMGKHNEDLTFRDEMDEMIEHNDGIPAGSLPLIKVKLPSPKMKPPKGVPNIPIPPPPPPKKDEPCDNCKPCKSRNICKDSTAKDEDKEPKPPKGYGELKVGMEGMLNGVPVKIRKITKKDIILRPLNRAIRDEYGLMVSFKEGKA